MYDIEIEYLQMLINKYNGKSVKWYTEKLNHECNCDYNKNTVYRNIKKYIKGYVPYIHECNWSDEDMEYLIKCYNCGRGYGKRVTEKTGRSRSSIYNKITSLKKQGVV